MNKVYALSSVELSPKELADYANGDGKKIMKDDDFIGDHSRIVGNHCSCNGNGIFVLLPKDCDVVKSGGKAYMRCIICGGVSHL